ncbi:MAG: 3-phosphoshikimate 1-carboxyvinyltransferase [Acidobacteriales bacterium]|nr:3-phosphoshikimate 1-carboxyvinyltransferase [Terriglobales bacterium]
MSSRLIRPAKNILGSMRLPGDKSISHRYAMLAALAEGKTRLSNFSTGADCASTLSCVAALGAQVTRSEDHTIEISGCTLSAPAGPLDCGNSGSTMRMLAGILTAQPFSSELIGDDSLSHRPMARIVEPLSQMGARITASEGGRPPLHIQPAKGMLNAIDYAPPTPSAQVKTGILFAGLHALGETSVEEPFRTRDHGELALRAFGAEVTRSRGRVSIRGGQRLHAIEALIPGDISTAAFFLCAAAIFHDSNLVFENLMLNPTRSALLDVLYQLGARVSVIDIEERHGELAGTVKVEHHSLRGATIRGPQAAQLIDELPVLAAIAPFTEQGIEIRDAGELRVKESDRIASVAANLRKMGAQVTEHEDGLSVPGGQTLHGAELDSAGDHRIAMAFAVAALRAQGDTLIHGADTAGISFPGFWSALDAVTER